MPLPLLVLIVALVAVAVPVISEAQSNGGSLVGTWEAKADAEVP